MDRDRDRLLSLMERPDPYHVPGDELRPLQFAAAQESFEHHRSQIPLLAKRADEAGIDSIESIEDLVPLLFSHTVYKAYPQSFIAKGQWGRLLAWYDSLSGQSVLDTDVAGVQSIDDFAAALADAGFNPHITSGTSGKVSLLNNTEADRLRAERTVARVIGTWPDATGHEVSMRFFGLGPSRGYSRHVELARSYADVLTRPQDIRFMSDEPMLPSQAARITDMRVRMADGSAAPEEIAQFEASSAARATTMRAAFDAFAEEIIDRRGEPILLMGMWSLLWTLMEKAHAMGVPDGGFHPDSIIAPGGGLKGIVLPADYREQIFAFFGDARRYLHYGMTECDPCGPMCEAGRYHSEPWVIWLVLDHEGERLGKPDALGVVDGRFAFLCTNYVGRWGGLITGDRVQMDLGTCSCGRAGPTIRDSVRRYSDEQGGDDKIGCAGSMEAYVRGMVGV